MTDATVLVLAAAEGLSGYATQTASAVSGVDPEACATEAAEKAARTRGAGELEAGVYRAVLEPYALAEMLQYFAWDSFGALGLLEERSYLAGRIGERIFDEKVSIADDALDARGLPKAFDFEGRRQAARSARRERRRARCRLGSPYGQARGRRRAHDRTRAARRRGRRTGPSRSRSRWRAATADSVDELVAAVDDGIYVTRVHYLGIVDPRGGVLTGHDP